jgi:hypothetical protein
VREQPNAALAVVAVRAQEGGDGAPLDPAQQQLAASDVLRVGITRCSLAGVEAADVVRPIPPERVRRGLRRLDLPVADTRSRPARLAWDLEPSLLSVPPTAYPHLVVERNFVLERVTRKTVRVTVVAKAAEARKCVPTDAPAVLHVVVHDAVVPQLRVVG